MSALAQPVDHAAAELVTDRLPESLTNRHTLLQESRKLLHNLLTSRSTVERDSLAQFIGREGAGLNRCNLIDDFVHARVKAFQDERQHGIEVALHL